MKIDLPKTPLAMAELILVVALAATSMGLSVALWAKASRKPEAVIVEGADGPRVVEPGRIPDALARDFAMDYIVTFETYSPATIDAVSTFLRSRIAPAKLAAFSPLLENRKKLVRESSMVSQLLVEDPGRLEVDRDGLRVQVTLRATRRVYVADRLAQEAKLTYRIALESAQPTRENPTGLLVTGQAVKTDPLERNERNGAREN